MMKKRIALVLSLALCAGLFAGCSGATTSVPKRSGTVSTDGSTSMEKVVGSLGEAFQEETGVAVSYNATGSSAGIQAVTEKRCDIGMASRGLKETEAATLDGTVVALDGISIVVSRDNVVSDLTLEQLTQIFDGTIQNWKDVGGADAEIVCIGREGGSGTRDGFETITNTKDNCVYRNELTSTGAVLEAVKSNPNAIGYASLSAVKEDVKALTVNGVAPSEITIQDGSYPVQRAFVLVTRKGEALTEAAQAFMDFATGEAAHQIIIAAGAVPILK